jgi:hypothetical protein
LLVTKELSSTGLVAAGAKYRDPEDEVSEVLISVPGTSVGVASAGSVAATRAVAVGKEDALENAFAEAAFALEVEAAESGVDAGEGRPRRSAAKADDPNNAKNIAATATLISLPRRERKRARTIEYLLNAGFYWQFLPRKPLVKIGPATELRELRALPEEVDRNAP